MGIMFNEVWTIERVARLTELWAKCLSASQIADDLQGGISRSGVIAKIHRLKLPHPVGKAVQPLGAERRSKNNPLAGPRVETKPSSRPFLASAPAPRSRPDPLPRRNPSNSIAAKIAIAEAEPGLPENLKGDAPDGTGVKFADLERGQCKWPKGNPGDADFEFCGCKALPDLPYCAPHTRRSMRAPQSVNHMQRAMAGV